MARECTICTHPKLGAIEVDLLAGGPGNSMRSIADRYAIQRTSLARHRDNCMGERGLVAVGVRDALTARSDAALALTADRGAEVARSAIARVESLLGPVLDAVKTAERLAKEQAHEPELVLKAILAIGTLTNVAHTSLRTLGQASGEIPTSSTNVMVVVGDVADPRNANPVAVAFREALAVERAAAARAGECGFRHGSQGRPAGEVAALRATLAEALYDDLAAGAGVVDTTGVPVAG